MLGSGQSPNKRYWLRDAGDSFQGNTLFFLLPVLRANAALLNQLAADAMVVGNHELDTGNTPLATFRERSRFPLLAANLGSAGEGKINRPACRIIR